MIDQETINKVDEALWGPISNHLNKTLAHGSSPLNYDKMQKDQAKIAIQTLIDMGWRPLSQWLDISTAPKDASDILLYVKHPRSNDICTIVGFWAWSEGWCEQGSCDNNLQPTHWMRLPEPPKEDKL